MATNETAINIIDGLKGQHAQLRRLLAQRMWIKEASKATLAELENQIAQIKTVTEKTAVNWLKTEAGCWCHIFRSRTEPERQWYIRVMTRAIARLEKVKLRALRLEILPILARAEEEIEQIAKMSPPAIRTGSWDNSIARPSPFTSRLRVMSTIARCRDLSVLQKAASSAIGSCMPTWYCRVPRPCRGNGRPSSELPHWLRHPSYLTRPCSANFCVEQEA
jgi:hypothetical protein